MQNQYKDHIVKYNPANKQQLGEYIRAVMKGVEDDGEYCLYVHKVYDIGFNDRKAFGDSARSNMDSILDSGLNTYRYTSLLKTAKFLGDATESKSEDVLNYTYPWYVNEHIVVFMAIPKTIKINGYDINFSEPEFNIRPHEEKRDDFTNCQFAMLFDALRLLHVQPEFIAGAYVSHLPTESEESFENRGGKYELYLNENFICAQDLLKKENIMKPIQEKVVKEFRIDTTDSKDIILKKIYDGIRAKDSQDLKKGSYDEDFDFD